LIVADDIVRLSPDGTAIGTTTIRSEAAVPSGTLVNVAVELAILPAVIPLAVKVSAIVA
jgi:hypothetical protein